MSVWKSIPQYPTYEVSDCGIVRNIKNGKILKPYITRQGYARVSPNSTRVMVHRLVAETFIGLPPSEYHEIDHINRNKLDNTVSNLRWVTKSENQRNKGITIRSRTSHLPHHINMNRDRFMVRIKHSLGNYYASFTNLEDAINARDMFIERIKS